MNHPLFPPITPDICRRYIAQARATPNAISIKLKALTTELEAQRSEEAKPPTETLFK